MSTDSRKHPASNRGQVRRSRRDVVGAPSERTGAGGNRSSALGAVARSPGAGPPRAPAADARRSPAVAPDGGTVERPTRVKVSTSGEREPMETEVARPRRGFLFWRRANRRITVQSHSPVVWLGEQLAALARRLLIVGKILGALALLAAAAAGARLGAQHVVASPRFALRDVRVGPTVHVTRDELIERSTVELGDRLLALDTDVIAARLARHPWIASARVRRELPSTLVIDVTERQAAAVAVIGGLYLLDDRGHPFKRATLAEADGQLVLTGISRSEYAGLPRASEAAFREALALFAEYQHPDSLAAVRHRGTGSVRPALSEIHIDPRTGFSLFLYDSGTEIRLGRGAVADKLARLDEILAEFGPRGVSGLRVVYLDGPAGDRVPIRLAPVPDQSADGTADTKVARSRSSAPARPAQPTGAVR